MNSNCMHLVNDNNITVPIISVNDSNKHRPSSPRITNTNLYYLKNSLMNKSFVANISENFSFLFIGNISYIIYIVEKHAFCSTSNNVELEIMENNNCKPYKYLTSESFVYELQCISLLGTNHTTNVLCNRFNQNLTLSKEGVQLETKKLVDVHGTNYETCCFNQTHSLQFFGDCKLTNLKTNDETLYEKEGSCNKNNNQWNIGFLKRKSCLLKISYKSLCNKMNKMHPMCFNINCSDKIDII